MMKVQQQQYCRVEGGGVLKNKLVSWKNGGGNITVVDLMMKGLPHTSDEEGSGGGGKSNDEGREHT